MHLRAERARLWWAVTAITRLRPMASASFTSARESRRPLPRSTSIRHWHRLHQRVVTTTLRQESSRRIWAVDRPTTTLSNEPAPWMCKLTLFYLFFFIHLKTLYIHNWNELHWIALNWMFPHSPPRWRAHSIRTGMRRLPTPLSNPT